jgi:hypothetical protein
MMHLATRNNWTTEARFGSQAAANFCDRDGGTCFNTGRQGTQPLCILLIDAINVAINGKRRAAPLSGPDVAFRRVRTGPRKEGRMSPPSEGRGLIGCTIHS